MKVKGQTHSRLSFHLYLSTLKTLHHKYRPTERNVDTSAEERHKFKKKGSWSLFFFYIPTFKPSECCQTCAFHFLSLVKVIMFKNNTEMDSSCIKNKTGHLRGIKHKSEVRTRICHANIPNESKQLVTRLHGVINEKYVTVRLNYK